MSSSSQSMLDADGTGAGSAGVEVDHRAHPDAVSTSRRDNAEDRCSWIELYMYLSYEVRRGVL